MRRKSRNRRRVAVGCGLLLVGLWILWGNVTVKTTHLEIRDDALPPAFEGFRIAHLSDLHNAEFGENNAKLIHILEKEQPDLIALTGDLVDANHTDLEVALDFAEQAVEIAPCYYVTGNHEAWLGEAYRTLEEGLTARGVTVLRNRAVRLERGEQAIAVLGIDDPDFAGGDPLFSSSAEIVSAEIQQAGAPEGYRILLSHRPEVFETYAEQGIQLALCGHAHGGQFRIPFVGGVVAPNQGFFPEYDGGLYTQGDTRMVVSRGIGNSIIPVRIHNRPEVVIVSLRGET